MNQPITRFGIDLAKNTFQACAVGAHGKVIFNRPLKRSELAAFVADLPACEVVMEACTTSNCMGDIYPKVEWLHFAL